MKNNIYRKIPYGRIERLKKRLFKGDFDDRPKVQFALYGI